MRKLMARGAALVLLLILACGARDDRNQIRERNGEPEVKQSQGKDIYWREFWFYTAAGQGYEFRRNAGCGSYHDTFLYSTFYFQPDTSAAAKLRQSDPKHSPNGLSEPGNGIVAPY